jgi:hypothetical protein
MDHLFSLFENVLSFGDVRWRYILIVLAHTLTPLALFTDELCRPANCFSRSWTAWSIRERSLGKRAFVSSKARFLVVLDSNDMLEASKYLLPK